MTLLLTLWLVGAYYAIRHRKRVTAGLRDPSVPRHLKVLLVIAALPIPGPVDELVGAYALARIARRTRRA